MASRCSGRKSEKPQTRWSTSSRSASYGPAVAPARAGVSAPVPRLGSGPPWACRRAGGYLGPPLPFLHVRPLDVRVDEALEFNGELVVRAAQGGDVLAVDVDRTVRGLAGSRQADADVGGLRFARPVDDASHDRQRHRLDALVR